MLVLIGPLIGGCTGGPACGDPNPTIAVTVIDSETGRSIADGAAGFMQRGTERSDLFRMESFSGGETTLILVGMVQAAGFYQVTITHPGYSPFDTAAVRVERGSCYPRGPAFTARLDRTAASDLE